MAGRHLLAEAAEYFVRVGIKATELDDLTVLGDEDVGVGNAGLLGQAAVQYQVPVLAVRRQEILGTHKFQHVQIVFASAMAADVDVAEFMVEHVGSLAEQIVNRAVEQLLVAREWAWR